MKSRFLVGLTCSLAVMMTAACGGDDPPPNNTATGTGGDGGGGDGGNAGGAGPGSTGTGTGGTASTNSGPAPASSSSGAAGDGNNTFETAEQIDIPTPQTGIEADLDPVATDEDFYTFTGTKGDLMLFLVDSKPAGDEFSPEYPDVVLSLYNDKKELIAQNDDPSPRSSNDSVLITMLPSDGKYFVRVTECTVAFPSGACAETAAITNTAYILDAFIADPGATAVTAEGAEPNDTADKATAVKYAKDPDATANDTGYTGAFVYSTFASTSDVDAFSFKVPTDVNISGVPGSRLNADFEFYPSGKEGNGSTAELGTIYITSKADPATKLAAYDPTVEGASITLPVTGDGEYLLFVPTASAAKGSNDFFFTYHTLGPGNPLETQSDTNDDIASPEALPTQDASSGAVAAFIDGDIGTVGDVDHYEVPVAAGKKELFAYCFGQNLGSGLRDLKVSVHKKSDGSSIGSDVETAVESAGVDTVAVPAGETALIFQVSAGSQASDVTSKHYRCVFGYADPVAP